MNPHVTVSLVTWNSARVLPHCLASLREQTYKDFSLTIIDNASIDTSIDVVREFFPKASVIQNPRNLGFGRGHNQAILLSRASTVLCLNPDTVLEPTAIEQLVARLDLEPSAAAVGPKLLRYELTTDELKPVLKTGIIDSAGVIRKRSGAFVEIGTNEQDHGQYRQAKAVLAVSGACVLLRRAALDDIQLRGEFFDEDFFAYKEDLDLCWRFRHRGWSIWVEPTAVVFHRRSAQLPEQALDPLKVRHSRNRRLRSIRLLSYRNHLLLFVKNESWGEWLRRLPWSLPYELGKLAYLLVNEPTTLAGVPQACRFLPRMLAKRKIIFRQRRAT